MKKILITGGSGFVGRHLIAKLLRRYTDIEVYSMSRSEGIISKLLAECEDERLKIIMGDVRDREVVEYALRDKDTVIHLAAMKRVDLSEINCAEATSINVIGTMNMLAAFRGNTFILMSTDKAVEPANCYGATKLIAERLVMEKAHKTTGARFMIVRSGNVMGSTGSVMEIWKSQIETSNEITITHPDMLRYYTSVDIVTDLYVNVLEHGENGKIYFVPSGEPIKLKDLAEQAIKIYGNEKTRVKVIGLRPGERMYEKMRREDEPNTVSGFENYQKQVTQVDTRYN
ncbi:MAG: polysaccharide biosynthesis protein [Dehalococcoidales bacterium]|jgi:FlaA1/EpsC-like NDP-sugar epimerase|nr:polysaccharide biosynthesis protein [Dehalococcoidales bacterium]